MGLYEYKGYPWHDLGLVLTNVGYMTYPNGNTRVSRGNENNVKTQLFRREENKRLVSFCRGIFTISTNLSVPGWNETNHNFIVISFIPSWNVFVCEENKCSMREWKQSGLSLIKVKPG